MTRFYLHLHEQGKVVPDAEGLERPDLASAMRAAVDSLRDVMAADVLCGRLDLSGRIEVADRNGAILGMVAFVDVVSVTGG
jgi:hypothetical protein